MRGGDHQRAAPCADLAPLVGRRRRRAAQPHRRARRTLHRCHARRCPPRAHQRQRQRYAPLYRVVAQLRQLLSPLLLHFPLLEDSLPRGLRRDHHHPLLVVLFLLLPPPQRPPRIPRLLRLAGEVREGELVDLAALGGRKVEHSHHPVNAPDRTPLAFLLNRQGREGR